jgi:hypothetical protein
MARHVPALVAYSALAAAMLWPLPLHLSDRVPHDLGDPLLSMWTFWWNATVLPFTEQWWNAPLFFPAAEAITFSDHRLGISVFTTPLIWLGASPLAAYNAAFVLSYIASAFAAYCLALELTANRATAFVGGLIFGFNPFRAEHLAHLELLCAYWLPVGLLALHRWTSGGGHWWLVLLSVALTLQVLTSAYYFAFFGVLIGLWLLWFLPRNRALKQYAALALSLLVPLAIAAPIYSYYQRAHARVGMMRTIADIEGGSADLIALVTPPDALALWPFPAGWYRTEGALYPGGVAVLLVAVALVLSRRSSPSERLSRVAVVLRRGALGVAILAFANALIPVLFGSVGFSIAGQRVSISRPSKSLVVALCLLAVWCLTGSTVRSAWRRRSPLAFYTLATMAMWVLALGPTARVLGERVLYKAPYAWLMPLPGFGNAFRIPARFGMIAALTLSVAGAVALTQILARTSTRMRRIAVLLIAAAIAVDGWISPLPLIAPPRPLAIPASLPAGAAILELPTNGFADAQAMYRAIVHRRPLVNGLSGYQPPHSQVLGAALGEGQVEVLPVLATVAPIAVFVDRTAPGDLPARVRALPTATLIAEIESHDVLLISASVAAQSLAGGGSAPRATAVHSVGSASDPAHVNDGDLGTIWVSRPQDGGEELRADIGQALDVSGVEMSHARAAWGFPRRLSIALSTDGEQWIDVWDGATAPLALAAALARPRDVLTRLPFAPQRARYVRLRQTGQSPYPWAVAELRVVAAERSRVSGPGQVR